MEEKTEMEMTKLKCLKKVIANIIIIMHCILFFNKILGPICILHCLAKMIKIDY